MIFYNRARQYLSGKIHNINPQSHFNERFGTGVNIMQARLYSFEISAKFLINAGIALLDNLIWIIDTATAYAGGPCSQASTYLAPAMHAFPIGWYVIVIVALLRDMDVLYFCCECLFLVDYQMAVLFHCFYCLNIIIASKYEYWAENNRWGMGMGN